MLCAALLSNVAMIDLQEALQRQQTPLTDEQKEQIRLHPVMAIDLMLDAGIQDDLLFNAVLHHHEKYDGSGYPGTLRGDDIPLIVRTIALADTYSAMIAPRIYRGHILARDALREIFLKRGSAIDGDLAQLIIKELGVFPPGAFVKLHNGETALVIKRGANATNPLVQSVVGPRGAPLPTPIKRDCNDSRYAIHEMVVRDRVAVLDLHKLWGYH